MGFVKLVNKEPVRVHDRICAIDVHECNGPADGEGKDRELPALHIESGPVKRLEFSGRQDFKGHSAIAFAPNDSRLEVGEQGLIIVVAILTKSTTTTIYFTERKQERQCHQ